jgi:1-phosphatidylinositol-3-phosphate 5-kinase
MATTQTERESMNAALDNYHNAAYQSESLTLFSEQEFLPHFCL